jgi:hypothetical protein
MNEIIEQRRGENILIRRSGHVNTYNVVVISDSSYVKMTFGPFTLSDASTLADLLTKAPIIEAVK